ncbi:MAG: MBL fold metallo-hydrolase [Candidatus Nanosyncoccaceae bacterium]|jgi:L-ascorbate metabolism protein UlaG (beta-lactamase superfamily)
MVEIEYFGGNCVKIISKDQTIVVDPKRSVFGLDDVSSDGMIELSTETRLAIRNNKAFLQIDGPGEYEVADFSIRGFSANRQTDFNNEQSVTNYTISSSGVNIVVIGNIADELSEAQLEELGVTDILIIPIGGGGYTLDAKIAGDIVNKIDPKLVIPVHYQHESLRYEVPQDGFDRFSNELGTPIQELDKYKIKKIDALPESLEIIKLKLKIK